MSSDDAPNTQMKSYWDEEAGARWVAQQAQLDGQLAPYGDAVLEQAELRPGQRVLDVGCGCGATTVGAAEQIGSDGSLVGVDLSRAMLERTRERLGAAGYKGHLDLLVEDAQVYPFESASFDVIVSRFGVMFFDAPEAAFRNLAQATRPGERLVFSCWQTRERNVWMTTAVEAALRHLEPPPPPEPDAPGPFSLAIPRRTQALLEDAGLREVVITPAEDPIRMGSAESAAELMMDVGPASGLIRDQRPTAEVQEALRRSLVDAYRVFEDGGEVAPPAAAWIVRATRR